MTHRAGINRNTKAILFDHDGTLIDSEAVHFALWQQVLNAYDITLEREFHDEKMAGIPVNQNAKDVIAHFSLDADPAELADQKHALTAQYLAEQAFPLMDDAKAAIERCYEAGFTLAIVTGGSRLSLEKTLTTHGFSDMFSATVAVEDVAHSKPAPDCYQKVLAMLELDGSETVAVEDTMYGMQAALGAGIACIAIPTENSSDHDFTGAVGRFDSLTQWLDEALAKP
ncbi:HAD family hydrolase [Salinimonas sediminis]|uniref:HAD family phosphatase n=1 Tax=Salinimonas sediminis TaxID=2303538 RepID=A0A346NII8_9ALTE|nr:HAD family phosphatase [Salinimonas sediminis]AXR05345.1 HAD family phosphatase [Salinimonas sediminis]